MTQQQLKPQDCHHCGATHRPLVQCLMTGFWFCNDIKECDKRFEAARVARLTDGDLNKMCIHQEVQHESIR